MNEHMVGMESAELWQLTYDDPMRLLLQMARLAVGGN